MTAQALTVEEASRVAREIAERRARTQARIDQLARGLQPLVDATHDSPEDEHDPEGATIGFERAQATEPLPRMRFRIVAGPRLL